MTYQQRMGQLTSLQEWLELPLYWGSGYPIDRPHILAVARYFSVDVWIYPEGDNGLQGMQLAPTDPCFRPCIHMVF